MHTTHDIHFGWKPLEKAAFGLIYGAIMVLSLIMALGDTPDAPFEPAMVLFGSVLAVTLAKAFSELLSHGIETGERILSRRALLTAWQHSHPTLLVANVPTALFLAVGLGWLTTDAATALSQVFCVAILVMLGARFGWVVSRGAWLPVAGALFAGGVGSALALLKYAIH
ncbi:hypothetical protein SAMN05421853_11656 [Roseivivax halotolerans]|uniref:Uncharacterized protein n=1 Tax=Roseivivax halotolerans TaxID=93684 RepID=A0A1I6A9L9_9RHOB|nr:hypothetical protein [Roseivivax halotolerans]SFQ65436.1 hypothetical protein SAMN05421853_11656 [Roseivivax halotolerans]